MLHGYLQLNPLSYSAAVCLDVYMIQLLPVTYLANASEKMLALRFTRLSIL